VQRNCKDGFCNIPAGCFVMGSPEDEWSHARLAEKRSIVTLTHSFAIQEHEVTRGEWIAQGLPDPNGRLANGMGDCTDDELCPVGNVSWFEAVSYANLLSEQHVPKLAPCYKLFDCKGQVGGDFVCKRAQLTVDNIYECPGFRLPNDAEWEYAARAGTRSAVYTGNFAWLSDLGECKSEPALEEIAWYCNNSGGLTHPVAQRTPNAWGLFDMIGNASEWVNDYERGLPPATPRDPGAQLKPNPDRQLHPSRIIRGCSYHGWSGICRAAYQSGGIWDTRGPGVGFRLVRSIL
jgi:formylglycine-generating enzyme required for sulfatase activity